MKMKARCWDDQTEQYSLQVDKHVTAEDGTEYRVIGFYFGGDRIVSLIEAQEDDMRTVEWFTGFHEENRDIYDGDVYEVVYECDVETHNLVGSVSFCDSTGMWVMDFSDFSVPLFKVLEDFNFKHMGNIREDSELLD